MDIQGKVSGFLKKYGMDYERIDLETCRKEFMDEMDAGLQGQDSSLMMLPTYLTANSEVPTDTKVIVMDAGGTNFRVATLYFNRDKEAVVEDFQLYPMPGTQGPITKEAFFSTVADYLQPVIHKSDKIGFCFSYPTTIMPNKDGVLIRFNKEVRIQGMEGMAIGAGISEELKRRGIAEDKTFILLNDTVATMLGGIMAYPERTFSNYIGFILGTGTNTCYLEKTENILKIQDPNLPLAMAINMESGGYGKIPRGQIDEDYDRSTNNPDEQKMEKMVSGAYQGTVIYLTIKKAVEDGLFSSEFGKHFGELSDITMRNIDDFCFYPDGNNVLADCVRESEEDRLTLYYIIDASFERAARIVTVNISSILVNTDSGKDPTRPVCVTAEGTTFYKSKLFRGKLDYYVKEYINDQLGHYCEFLKAENATLVGTAVAALLN